MHLAASNDAAPTRREFASWPFQASGNFNIDCDRGRGLARQFVSQLQLQDADSPTILQHLVESIAKRGSEQTGLEVGFFSLLERQLRQDAAASPHLSAVSG